MNLVETSTENIIPLTLGILRYKFSKTCTGHVLLEKLQNADERSKRKRCIILAS